VCTMMLPNDCPKKYENTEDGTKIRGFIKVVARALADTAAWKFSTERGASLNIVEGTVNGANVVVTFFVNQASLYVDGTQIRLRAPEQRKLGKEISKLQHRLRRIPEKLAIAKLEETVAPEKNEP
jgi:UDP-glucose 4-epimerase